MIRINRTLDPTDVLGALTDISILRGPPEYIKSDNRQISSQLHQAEQRSGLLPTNTHASL